MDVLRHDSLTTFTLNLYSDPDEFPSASFPVMQTRLIIRLSDNCTTDITWWKNLTTVLNHNLSSIPNFDIPSLKSHVRPLLNFFS